MPMFNPAQSGAIARTAAQLAAAPQAADIALGAGTTFYDAADPTKRYVINAAQTSFSRVDGGGNSPPVSFGGSLKLFRPTPSTTASAITFVLQHPALAPFFSYQLVYGNLGAAQTITSGKSALAPTDGNDGSTLVWTQTTFNGAVSLVQTAGSGAGVNTVPGIDLADRVFLPSLARTDNPTKLPLVQSRTYYAATNVVYNTVYGNIFADHETAMPLQQFASRTLTGDQVSGNTAVVPLRAGSILVPMSVIFDYGVPTVAAASVGDSIESGQISDDASTGTRPIVQRLCALKTTNAKIWQPSSHGIIGQGFDATYKTGLEVVSKLRPTYLFFRAWTINDTISQAAIDLSWAKAQALVEHCRRNNVIPVLCTTPPFNSYTTGQDLLLKVQNARVVAARGQILVSDDAAVIENPADRSKILPLYTDGSAAHLNNAGYDAIATNRAKLFA